MLLEAKYRKKVFDTNKEHFIKIKKGCKSPTAFKSSYCIKPWNKSRIKSKYIPYLADVSKAFNFIITISLQRSSRCGCRLKVGSFCSCSFSTSTCCCKKKHGKTLANFLVNITWCILTKTARFQESTSKVVCIQNITFCNITICKSSAVSFNNFTAVSFGRTFICWRFF